MNAKKTTATFEIVHPATRTTIEKLDNGLARYEARHLSEGNTNAAFASFQLAKAGVEVRVTFNGIPVKIVSASRSGLRGEATFEERW